MFQGKTLVYNTCDDINGNMFIDLNKGTTSIIKYNHLNLPRVVTFASGNIEYIYDALGKKLRKRTTYIVGNRQSTGTTDYAGGFVYVNGVLQHFAHAEGYVAYEQGTNTFNYIYQYKDHLGNNRVSYTEVNGSPEVVEENHYYAFRLKHQGYGPAVSGLGNAHANQYKYNGKELNEELGLNWYDYEARNYEAAIGRWMNVDPLAEVSRRWSPYTYCYNNPVYFVDSDGMKAEPGQSGIYYDWDRKEYVDADGRRSTLDAAIADHENDDWIKNNQTGEVQWFDGSGQQATAKANAYWGFFNNEGQTTNLGMDFFGTSGETIFDNSKIKSQQLKYLALVAAKLDKMSGMKKDFLDIDNNITLEFLISYFMNRSSNKSDSKLLSDISGLAWDLGGSTKVEKLLVKGLTSATIFQLFDAFMSSRSLNVPDRGAHFRADAVHHFKEYTMKFLTPSNLLKISLHQF